MVAAALWGAGMMARHASVCGLGLESIAGTFDGLALVAADGGFECATAADA